MTMRRVLAVIGVVVLVAGSLWFWRACTETDESKILRVVEEGRTSIEEKSLRGVMGLLSPDYQDDLGLTADSVRPMLQRLFLGVQALRVDAAAPSPPVIPGDGTATVSLDVAVSGSLQDQPVYLMGTPSEPARVTLTLIKDGRKWLVREVRGIRLPELE